MPDICDLILDDHEAQRRGFAELDETGQAGPGTLAGVWEPLGVLLDLHAAAEEAVFYPQLLARGADAESETTDAIKDHNAIRDAVRAAHQAAVGSDEWWQAVQTARQQNSDHMGEEERGALADFRARAPGDLRDELGSQFAAFKQAHAGGRDLEVGDKDPKGYVAEESP